jgi:hypothetical protein
MAVRSPTIRLWLCWQWTIKVRFLFEARRWDHQLHHDSVPAALFEIFRTSFDKLNLRANDQKEEG